LPLPQDIAGLPSTLRSVLDMLGATDAVVQRLYRTGAPGLWFQRGLSI